MKRPYTAEDMEFAKAYLRKALECGGKLYLQESYGKDGPNGTPVQVRTFVVVDGEIECVTHYTLKATGEPMKESRRLGGVWVHMRGGGGYCRAQSVAESVFASLWDRRSDEFYQWRNRYGTL